MAEGNQQTDNGVMETQVSIEDGIAFLISKGAIIPSSGQAFLEDIYIDGLRKQTLTYFKDASKRLLSLLNSNETIYKQIPNDVHVFTNDEFPGYNKEDVFFLKYECQIQRYQKSGLCYLHAPTIVQTYKIIGSTKDATKTDVLDIANYIKVYFNPSQLHKHIFDNEGGSSEVFLKRILLHPSSTTRSLDVNSVIHNFNKFGPGLVSNFQVYGDFMANDVHHHYGIPNLADFRGNHSMVIVGWRKEGEKIFLLLQNWWKEKQFIEVDGDYFNACSPVTHFVTTSQNSIPNNFSSHSGVLHELSGIDVAEKLEETIIYV